MIPGPIDPADYDAESPLDPALIAALRSETSVPPPQLERRTLRALRNAHIVSRPTSRLRRATWIAAPLAAAVVFAAGFFLGSRHARSTVVFRVKPSDVASIRAAGAAYASALATADPTSSAARDAAVESFHAAGLVFAAFVPNDEYGRTVQLALHDAIRMAPQPEPTVEGGSSWF